jgi:hypothetical protein
MWEILLKILRKMSFVATPSAWIVSCGLIGLQIKKVEYKSGQDGLFIPKTFPVISVYIWHISSAPHTPITLSAIL